MTLGSATLVRAALAGAVVCLVAVGVTAPALAGDEAPCPEAGPIEALLDGEACAEDEPGPVLEPGSLLDPQFPDISDFPGLPDGDSDEEDDGSGEEDEDSDEDADSDEPASEDDSDDSDDTGAERDSDKQDSDDGASGATDDSDRDTSAAGSDARPAGETPMARDSGADAAVGAAVLPGVGDAIDGAESPGLDWTGALAPGRPSGPDGPRAPPPPVQEAPPTRVDPPPPPPMAQAAPAAGRTDGLAAVTFATSLPSPAEAGWGIGAVLPSLALTLLLLAALALPVGMVNRAAADQPDRVEALLARLRVPPGAGRPAPGAFFTAVAVTAMAGAVLLGFLTPQFPFDTSAPALLVGLVVAFVVVTAAQQGTQLLYVARWWGVRCHVGPVPGFLLLGAVSVVLSRAVGLEPGLVVGTLVAFRTVRPLRVDEEGPAVALAATALTAVGGTAWVMREPLVAAAGAPGTFLADTIATALTATAVSAAANLVFALVPFAFLPGAALLRWSPALWALFVCTGGFAFVHLVAGPAGPLAVLLGAYLLGTAALWAWLRHGPVWAAAARFDPAPRR
jgi:hypothetical protein